MARPQYRSGQELGRHRSAALNAPYEPSRRAPVDATLLRERRMSAERKRGIRAARRRRQSAETLKCGAR